LLTQEQEQRFSSQIMCTSDIFDRHTLIFFVHEFGNLRLELESSATCDIQSERSYLIDFSKELIAWVKSAGYALLDANLFPKPLSKPVARTKVKEDIGGDIVTYLWDNYIQLSDAKRVVLIGHGPGCQPLMHLLEARTTGILKSVKAVVQIVGASKVPTVPTQSDALRTWYTKHSFVVFPATHPILGPDVKPKDLRTQGHLVPIDEVQPVKLVTKALAAIADYIKEELERYPSNTESRTNHISWP